MGQWVYRLSIRPSQPGQLNLAIPTWVSKINIGNGYTNHHGKTVGPTS